jgi:hypothetical protein
VNGPMLHETSLLLGSFSPTPPRRGTDFQRIRPQERQRTKETLRFDRLSRSAGSTAPACPLIGAPEFDRSITTPKRRRPQKRPVALPPGVIRQPGRSLWACLPKRSRRQAAGRWSALAVASRRQQAPSVPPAYCTVSAGRGGGSRMGLEYLTSRLSLLGLQQCHLDLRGPARLNSSLLLAHLAGWRRPRCVRSAMPRRGTSKSAVVLPQSPTGPFGRSQTPKDRGLRQPSVHDQARYRVWNRVLS